MSSCAHKEPLVESALTPEVQPTIQPVLPPLLGKELVNDAHARGFIEELLVSKGIDSFLGPRFRDARLFRNLLD